MTSLVSSTGSVKKNPRGFLVLSHKRCSRCTTFKPIAEFWFRLPHGRSRNGYRISICYKCAAADQLKRHHARRGDPSYEAMLKKRELKARYGITTAQRDAMFQAGCAICGATDRKMGIDHDHATGFVRGALCIRHNNGLGAFQDSTILLGLAASYLLRARWEAAGSPPPTVVYQRDPRHGLIDWAPPLILLRAAQS